MEWGPITKSFMDLPRTLGLLPKCIQEFLSSSEQSLLLFPMLSGALDGFLLAAGIGVIFLVLIFFEHLCSNHPEPTCVMLLVLLGHLLILLPFFLLLLYSTHSLIIAITASLILLLVYHKTEWGGNLFLSCWGGTLLMPFIYLSELIVRRPRSYFVPPSY